MKDSIAIERSIRTRKIVKRTPGRGEFRLTTSGQPFTTWFTTGKRLFIDQGDVRAGAG
jgi:hypothetical protein